MQHEVKRLSLKNRLVVIAYLSELLLRRGLGNLHDVHWMTMAGSWLRALGITIPSQLHDHEERAA